MDYELCVMLFDMAQISVILVVTNLNIIYVLFKLKWISVNVFLEFPKSVPFQVPFFIGYYWCCFVKFVNSMVFY